MNFSGLIPFAIGFALPLVLIFFFIFISNKKYFMIDEDLRFSATSYGFPDDISGHSDFIGSIYVGKTIFYYVLLFVCGGLWAMGAEILPVAFKISCFILFVFVGKQVLALSFCKRAMRGLSNHDKLLFSPLRSIYRFALIYSIFLFTLFNLFFDSMLFVF